MSTTATASSTAMMTTAAFEWSVYLGHLLYIIQFNISQYSLKYHRLIPDSNYQPKWCRTFSALHSIVFDKDSYLRRHSSTVDLEHFSVYTLSSSPSQWVLLVYTNRHKKLFWLFFVKESTLKHVGYLLYIDLIDLWQVFKARWHTGYRIRLLHPYNTADWWRYHTSHTATHSTESHSHVIVHGRVYHISWHFACLIEFVFSNLVPICLCFKMKK